MKKIIVCIFLFAAMALALTGCDNKPKIPEEWYKETLKYYSEGFADGWKAEKDTLFVADEMKDTNNRFGYLLKDLDGDGADEVLIGFMDDENETRFIDVFVWHSDIGAFRILHAGDGYYIYLCENNILRVDKWYGSKTLTDYMKYQPGNNSFLKVNETAAPLKCGLTAF
jgi:hypothetical protein